MAPLGGGAYAARMDRGWWIVRGPNGGYVAAVLLRALQHAVGDPERAARSLTVHYTAPPGEGPVRIETVVERAGRSLTTLSGRLLQDGRLLALAIAAFSRPREGLAFSHLRLPEVPPPEACPAWSDPERIPLHGRYEYRWVTGDPRTPGAEGAGAPGEARVAGWIRCQEGDLADAPLLAAVADAWPPAVFRLGEPGAFGPVPTVDLTLHFRATLPRPEARPGEWVFARFASRLAREGFLEEDGEIWSRDGVLLAQSRQLAVLAGGVPPA